MLDRSAFIDKADDAKRGDNIDIIVFISKSR